MKRILKFGAPWCTSCKNFDRILEKIDIPVPVEYIDIDEQEEISKKFGIRGVPTMILMDGNVEMSRFSGLKNEKSLLEWINT